MTALNDNQLAVIRSWVGSGPTDEDLQGRYDRLGSIDATVLESLRSQLADLMGDPAQIQTPDGLSVGTQANIQGLQNQIKEFLEFHGTGIEDTSDIPESSLRGEFTVAKIRRPHRRGR